VDSPKSLNQEDHVMLYLAIDQHSKQLTVNLRDEAGDVLLRRQVSTRGDATLRFLDEVAARGVEEGGYMAILEVCGFNDWLVDLLPQRGCRDVVLVCAPKRSRNKTDRRDADKLGELLWINRQRLRAGQRVQGLRRVAIATPAQRADRRLTTLRRDVGRRRTRTINQVKHLLMARNRLHDLPTKGIQTKAARAWLRQLALEACDRLELDQLLQQWEMHDRHLQELENRIVQRHQQHPTSAIVASIPGCGAYSALAIASRIGRIERFPSPRSLSNYFGLVPGCRNSGEATQRLGSITKAGSPIVRFLLGQLVLHVLRRDPWMRRWYKDIRRRRGSKIARVAVMRRLTTILWHMLSKGQAYQRGGPPRRKLARAGTRG
jgi:transposase